ncbi:oligosaccharide flippase family protein [uncultured Sphingomonas sp.]|uniref:oligosaccharide flippase family protein n=1 Tax=uncultured Sphingomonas sp. TaxID=158754 RepID=UPI0035CC4BE6
MSVRKAFMWSATGQVLSFLAGFGATVALARILSPRDTGVYAAGLAVLGMLQAVSAFGVGSFIMRDEAVTRATLATAFTVNLAICVLLSTLVFAGSYSSWVTAGEPMVGQVMRLLAVVPLLYAIEFTPAIMLQREMRFGVISVVTVARVVVGAVVGILAALAGARALSAAYGGIAGALVGAVGFAAAARHHVHIRLSVQGWRPLVSFGFKTLMVGGVSALAMRLSEIILSRMLGFAALGVFSRASTLSNTVFQNLYGAAARVLFAKLADDHRAGAGLKRGYLQGLDVILALMWPLLAGIAVLAAPAVDLLFGPRWSAAATPLTLLAIAQAIGLSFAMNHELFVLRDEVGRQGRLELVRSVVGLAAFVYGCTFGLTGAALGRVADTVVGAILYVPLLSSLSGAGRRELATVYARALALTAAAVAPAVAVMTHARWEARASAPALGVAVLIGGMLWLCLLRLLGHPLFADVARAAARFRPRYAAAADLSTPPL